VEDVPGVAGVFRIAVDCSSGTYVRSLAADLGAALGGGAHLRNLQRTAVGPYSLAEAVPLDTLGPEAVRPMTDAVRHLRSVIADEHLAAAAAVGKVLDRADLGVDGDEPLDDDGPWALLSVSGDLLAVYEPYRGSTVKPAVVVASR
jgi:tRNA pseudouridine55 synthase